MRRAHVLLGLALLFAAGCSAATGPEAPPSDHAAASTSDVAWMEEFCTVVGDLQTGLFAGAAEPGAGDGSGLRERLDSDLAGAAEALGVAVDRLGELPEDAPAGGRVAVAELARRLTGLRDSVVTGQRSLAGLPPDTSEQDVSRVMSDVWPEVAAKAGKPLDGVAVTGGMKAAADGLACRTVPGLG